jgi:hypothetical protein
LPAPAPAPVAVPAPVPAAAADPVPEREPDRQPHRQPQRPFLRRFDLDQCVNELHVREGYQRGELEGKLADAGLMVDKAVYTHGPPGTLAWELWRLTRPSLLAEALLRPGIEVLIALERLTAPRTAGNRILVVARKP